MYSFTDSTCLHTGRADPNLVSAFGKLEDVPIEGDDAFNVRQYSRASIIQAVNVPSLVSISFIQNSTLPSAPWTADMTYAMPEYEKSKPSSLNVNWMFANSDCVYGSSDDFTGMNWGSVDVSYTSTKQCFPLPVQDVTGE